MRIGNLKLSTFQLINLIALVILLVAFVFLPFISTPFTWISGFWFFISWLYYGFQFITSFFSSGLMGYVPGGYLFGIFFGFVVFGVYLAAWQLILYFGIKALIALFKNNNFYDFTKYSKRTYLTALIVCVVWFFVRLILMRIIESFASSYFGVFGSFAGAATGSLIGFGFGYFIILIAGIVGFILPYAFKEEAQQYNSGSMNQGIQNFVDNSKQFISKTASNMVSNRKEENTGDMIPIVVLDGPNQVVQISKLPSKIGRNRELVDNYIFDKSISRQHAELILYEGNILIQDIGSKFGTYLNNEQLPANQYYQLFNGDILRLGNIEFNVKVNENFLGIKSSPQINNNWDQDSTVSQVDYELNKVPLTNTVNNKQEELNLENNSNKTIFLGNEDPNKTLKLDSHINNNFPEIILKSTNNEDYYVVDKAPYVIGTDFNQVDLKLNDSSISKRHLKIDQNGGDFFIIDFESTNGTKVNGNRIKPNESYPINSNDVLTIGRQEFIFKKN